MSREWEWGEGAGAGEVLGRSEGQAGGKREGGGGGGREVSLDERASSLAMMSDCFCVRSSRVAVAVVRGVVRGDRLSGHMFANFCKLSF